jgi:hypothetical protein
MGVESDILSAYLPDASAENVDAICETQTLAEAGALELDGSAVTNGVGIFYPARQAAIVATVGATRLFTIVGTDEFGVAQTVVVEYTAVMSQVITTEYWSTITSITVNGAAADVTVGDDASFAYVVSPSRARLKGLQYVQTSATNKLLTILDGATEKFKCTLVGKGAIADIQDNQAVVYIPQNGILFESNMVIYGEQGDFTSVNIFYQR